MLKRLKNILKIDNFLIINPETGFALPPVSVYSTQ